jgi:hypothetical protein
MNDNPHLVDDFFGMLTRYIKYAPQILLRCPSIESLLKLAEIGMPVKNTKAAIITYAFISRTISLVFEPEEGFRQ